MQPLPPDGAPEGSASYLPGQRIFNYPDIPWRSCNTGNSGQVSVIGPHQTCNGSPTGTCLLPGPTTSAISDRISRPKSSVASKPNGSNPNSWPNDTQTSMLLVYPAPC